MAKTALNKSALTRQREQLKLYRKVLPSLDLKRQQLTAELNKARQGERRQRQDFERTMASIGEQLPMLANEEMDLASLIEVEAIPVEEENLLGVRLPALGEVVCRVRDYSMLAKPHYVDAVAMQLERMVRLQAEVEVAGERVRQLDRAVRRITQRVNLFDKILIPNAKRDIQRIRIFLGDQERDSVVRSKLAKAKHRKLAAKAAVLARSVAPPPDAPQTGAEP